LTLVIWNDMTTLTPLAARSDFSLGESLLDVNEIPVLAKQAGYESVILTDTMTVSGLISFSNSCKKQGVKGVVGCRLRIVDEPTDQTQPKKREKPNREFFIKVYVKNEEGLKALYRLLTLANEGEHYYYHPRLGIDEVVEELHHGNLLVSTGDMGSVFHHPDYREHISKLASAAGSGQTFIELVPVQTPLFDTLNEKAIQAAREMEIQPLVTLPAMYLEEEDADTLDVLSAITTNQTIAAPWRPKQYVKDFIFCEPSVVIAKANESKKSIESRRGEEWCRALWKSGMQNSRLLVDQCNFTWEKQDVSLPVMAPNESQSLLAKIQQGWKDRLMHPQLGYQPADLAPYKERLKYEIGVLRQMGFERYFLLVHDLVNWSKENGIIVGPGRGSVGGSLIAYLIGIHDVDPLRFGLFFERFINPERLDLPDADLDFMSSRRGDVIEYLTERYGSDRVAGISNYSTLASGSAMRDTSRLHEIPSSDYSCSSLVPKVHGSPVSLEEAREQVPEIDQFSQDHPEVWKHALKLQGRMRSYAKHAAGVVVGGEPIVNRAVVERRKDGTTVNWDKRVVEDQGLVKMDILGLSTLDVLKIAQEKIQARNGVTLDFMNMPLDDEKVLEAFGKGETVGVFQFESAGMQNLLKNLASVTPLTFDDIAAATALYRPGPMDSGLLDQYVGVKTGMNFANVEHPNMQKALETTYGVIVYQEQVMQIAQDLAGFTMAQADHLRKAMGKKDAEKMAAMRERWIEGCLKSGMPEFQSNLLFDKIEKFAGYAFNRSHAVEYSVISYWAMYLKVYYPAEFFAASMTILDEEKLPGLVADAESRGIIVYPPDINVSTGTFEVGYDKAGSLCLYAPFNRVKGCSENTERFIMQAREKLGRPFETFCDFFDNVNKTRVNKRVQGAFDKVGVFANLTFGPEEEARHAKSFPHITLKQIAPRHPDRIRQQKALLPGLIGEPVKADRYIVRSPELDNKLAAIRGETYTCEACNLKDNPHMGFRIGRSPKVMIVTDAPNWQEEKSGELMSGSGGATGVVKAALKSAGLSTADCYFTTLVKSKKPQGQKFFENDQVNACSQFLRREIEILKPPIIVALGSTVARYLVKDLKGSINELSGTVSFDVDLDASIIIGLSPVQVSMDGTMYPKMEEVFAKVAEHI